MKTLSQSRDVFNFFPNNHEIMYVSCSCPNKIYYVNLLLHEISTCWNISPISLINKQILTHPFPCFSH